MKTSASLIMLVLLLINAPSFGQAVTLSRKNISLENVFAEIQKQTGYNFFYKDTWLANSNNININVRKEPLIKVLNFCFNDQPVAYTITGTTIIVNQKFTNDNSTEESNAPKVNIAGVVRNEKGELLDGITVIAGFGRYATSTNSSGQFSLKGIPSDSKLIITGTNIERFDYNLAGKTSLSLTVQTRVSSIEEVIVSTGYQMLPRERATGSFVQIDNELFNRKVSVNVLDRLDGISNGILFDKRGESLNIQIRGLFTLTPSISQPLIVLDNFPYEGNINNINPNDVESVTILKDAAATSIWGAKAGNGVIVITTKKGSFNQPLRMSFNSNVTVRKEPDLFDIPNIAPAQYVDAEKELFNLGAYDNDISSITTPLSPVVEILLKQRNGELTAGETQTQLDKLRRSDVRNDFQKYLYRNGVNQQYALNMGVGREKMKHFFSVGYDKGTDIRVGNGTNRLTLRSDNTFKPVKNLMVRVGVGYANTLTRSNSPLDYTSLTGESSKGLPLYTSLSDENGNPTGIMYYLREAYTDTLAGGRLLDWKYRPLQELANNDNTLRTHALTGDFDLRYNFTRALTGEVKYQFQRYVDRNDKEYNLETYLGRDLINNFTQINGNHISYIVPKDKWAEYSDGYMNSNALRTQLNFNKNWNNTHRINALAGFEIRQVKTWRDNYYTFTEEVNRDEIYPTITGGANNVIPDGYNIGRTNIRFVSWFGNASYTFKERYLITASARKDESNLFGVKSNEKGVPLWSIGGGWKISKENFYPSALFGYLNLRVTYGYIGNVNNSLSALTIIYRLPSSSANIPFYTGLAAYPNPRLGWEKVRTLNLGMDFSSKNKRVQGSFEYFHKKSTDVVATQLVDPTVGVGSLATNSAGLTGEGIDFQINTLNINNHAFKWRTSFVYNHVDYKVSTYLAGNKAVLINDGLRISPLEGYTPYLLVSTKWGGLDASGDARGILNGQPSKDYSGILALKELSDYQVSGSALPSNFGNLINTFSWKRFSLSTNIIYKLNYFFRRPTVSYSSLKNQSYLHPDYLNRWQKTGDEFITDVPSLRYPISREREVFYTSSQINVEKGDNIRLDDIRVSYDLDMTKKNKTNFKSAQLYLYITNMNTILWRSNKLGIDPDFPRGYKFPINISLGLKTDF